MGVDDAREGEEDTGEETAAGVLEIWELIRWMTGNMFMNIHKFIRGTNMRVPQIPRVFFFVKEGFKSTWLFIWKVKRFKKKRRKGSRVWIYQAIVVLNMGE